ncbi:Ceramidase [Bosea sp. OK403]|uniref:ceramidase domain-containing protein n=1 Tax=Bosea sp. OK403 TaxID=1855286 RepID=UPI0008EC0420|nr:ceramidase domain-containing protein [Bosea sp. OK403]SFI15485.1 Ceramidase [Bosea sp. OK403]
MLSYGYCERLSGAFWAEPWNALTNGAFLLAAVAAFQLWRRGGGSDRPSLALTLLVFAIGIGSFLYHTMPQGWTLAADVVPIQLFAFCYFGLALTRFFGLSWRTTVLGTLAFFAFALLLSGGVGSLLPQPARGSAGYAAFLLALAGVTGTLLRRPGCQDTARQVGSAGLVFAVSLAFRTLDGALCGGWSMGTHWLWHLLNAGVLYLLLRAAILR